MNNMGEKRVCAMIHLDRVRENIRIMQGRMKSGQKICAVVKTDGYGHGAARIAGMLEPMEELWGFAVAAVSEAVALRRAGIQKPILILGATFPEEAPILVKEQLRAALVSTEMARTLSEEAEKQGVPAYVHIAIDTGMSRIGFFPGEEALEEIREIYSLPGIVLEGIFTHFARADEEDKSCALAAAAAFTAFLDRLEQEKIPIPVRHMANSAAILELPETHLDMVRAGISLYGIYPSEEMRRDEPQLRPVMELKSHIVSLRTMPAGTPVSYGGTYVTHRETRLATIPVGYGDGYPRALSSRGYVLIGGKRAPILGRICMDQMMADVTDIPARLYQEVTLMGEDGDETLSVYTLSSLSGKFPYEFVCGIGPRVPRHYLDE